MNGLLVLVDGKLRVQSTDTLWTEPTLRTIQWDVVCVRSPYGPAPEPGVELTYDRDGWWKGPNGSLFSTGSGDTKAQHLRFESVPCPKVRRGIETRWYQGRWQKLLRSGWKDLS